MALCLFRYSFVNVRIFFFSDLIVGTIRLLQKQIPCNFVYNCQFTVSFNMECTNKHFRHILLFLFS